MTNLKFPNLKAIENCNSCNIGRITLISRGSVEKFYLLTMCIMFDFNCTTYLALQKLLKANNLS